MDQTIDVPSLHCTACGRGHYWKHSVGAKTTWTCTIHHAGPFGKIINPQCFKYPIKTQSSNQEVYLPISSFQISSSRNHAGFTITSKVFAEICRSTWHVQALAEAKGMAEHWTPGEWQCLGKSFIFKFGLMIDEIGFLERWECHKDPQSIDYQSKTFCQPASDRTVGITHGGHALQSSVLDCKDIGLQIATA